MTETKPTVLFLCTHNAGRSQMALGYFNHLAGERGIAWSGGSEPADEINPSAIAAMSEVGIDVTREFPKPWTDEIVRAADVVVTMGCGDACPFFPGKRYENWELPDPAGTVRERRPTYSRRHSRSGSGAYWPTSASHRGRRRNRTSRPQSKNWRHFQKI